MSLAPGTRLGPYEIRSPLGAGGMGEVYKARDARLGRDVAIKVLPAAFSADPERLDRFEQEARAAAALNHPNILVVYDIGQHNSSPYIVSELLEGETLRQGLSSGPLPVRKAVEYAVQITHGLAAAHEKGITHRDLKPENVFVTTDGRVKILDFGLAKLTQAQPTLDAVSALPTAPPNTLPGMVLGTVGYMSPEQVRGLQADSRSDIFALGAILYEMLSGRRAFHGETTMDALTAIVKEDPPDLPTADHRIPLALERIVHRCLEKNPAARFQSTRDLAFALEGLTSHSDSTTTISSFPSRRSRERTAWLVAAVSIVAAIVASVAMWVFRSRSPQRNSAIVRLTVTLPAGDRYANLELPTLALSSDGTQLAYAGIRERNQQLFVRRLDSLESKPISGTEGALEPFFSPDGQWVGFFAQGKLKKVSVTTGAVQVLCDSQLGRGASWGLDDTIYFAPSGISGLWKVPASGGTPTEVTKLNGNKAEVSHRWPQVLPGGKAVLFTVWTGAGRDERQIQVQVLGTGERHVLLQGGDIGRYVATGHLVYARADALIAVPMDLARFDLASTAPVPLGEYVRVGGEGAHYAVSDSGELVYLAGSPQRYERRLVWVDRKGTVERLPLPARAYLNLSISPDGHQAAVEIDGGTRGVWVVDMTRATLTPLTTPGSSQVPIWTPDGKRIVYRGTRMGFRNLFWKALDGTTRRAADFEGKRQSIAGILLAGWKMARV